MDQDKLDFKWLSLAWTTALMSKDPSTQVGAVIVSSDNRQCSTGYNGFPVGLEEDERKWQRPTKYEYVIHAEPNAICNCPFDTSGCTIYVTHEPCHRCLGLIVNAGIKNIVCNIPYENMTHKDVWNDIRQLVNLRYVKQNIRQKIADKMLSMIDKG